MEQQHITPSRLGRASSESHEPSPQQCEERVSILIGDRLCHQCGYNLTGQNVLREPHYRMLIVRCPECATVASVQEYPLLGRWANRWAMILAGLALLAMTGIWIGSGAAIFGFSLAVAEITAEKYRGVIDPLYYASTQQANVTIAGGTSAAQGIVLPPTTIQIPGQAPIIIQNVGGSRSGGFDTWWAAQDQAAIFSNAGGWLAVVEWRALWLWVPMAFAAFVIGSLWAVILLTRRGWSAVFCALAIMFVALFFSFFAMYDWLIEPAWSPRAAAGAKISPVFLAASLVFAVIPLSMGLLVGRSVARGVVRLMLPPRLCSALSLLWTVDGLNPPRMTAPRR